ncbi:MAG TPA: trigger factor [Candidatus Aminicenantes bacterium]|nr:trigger factor [Candidatus Aminicenantes bacterium]
MNHEHADTENKPVSPGPAAAAPGAVEDSPLVRRFQIEMPGAEMAGEIDRLAEETSRTMKMPGFRQGKVPVDVVKKVHQQALREEVVQKAVGRLAFARIERDRLAIAGEPWVEKLDDRGADGFLADVAVEVLPDFELPDLEKLRVELPAASLKAEPFDEAAQLERVLEAHKRSQPVSGRAAVAGDLAQLQVQSRDVASKRKWPRQETYFLLEAGKPSEIPGLVEALLGKSAGESLALTVRHPADAAKKAWAGKEIEHQVEIKALFELKKPELNEEFLKSLGMKSAEELAGRLRQDFEHHQEHRREEAVLEGIYDKLLEAVSFPVPRSLQEQEVARRLSQARQVPAFQDDGEKARFKELLFAQAEKAVRLSLILDKVRERFSLAVAPADLEKEYAHLAQHHQVSEREIRQYYGDEKRAAELKEHLLQARVNGFLREKIKVSEV